MGIRVYRPVLLAAFLGVAACAGLLGRAPEAERSGASEQQPLGALVGACGQPEIPRYIKFYELSNDRVTLLRSPTLQRGKPGSPIVLDRDVPYLYAIAEDGTFLVAENRPFSTATECGHPNLTGGRPARLSGELNYHAELGAMVIDNKSGRYGYQASRQRGHLSAARQLLEKVGVIYADGSLVHLVERWFEPRRDEKNQRIDCARPVLKYAPDTVDAAAWRGTFVAVMGFQTPESSPSCSALQ